MTYPSEPSVPVVDDGGAVKVGIVIPTLEEASTIVDCLTALEIQTPPFEVIVVDGGSSDQTLALAATVSGGYPLKLERSPQPGRAFQMNWGASQTQADLLLFLHADSRLPDQALTAIRDAMTETDVIGGRFQVQLDCEHWPYPLISWGINWRSRMTGCFTGDMGLFIRRSVFEELQGYRLYPLMEDLDLSDRMKARGKQVFLKDPIITSSRRFKAHGPWRTIAWMQILRGAYRLGIPPTSLAQWYRSVRD